MTWFNSGVCRSCIIIISHEGLPFEVYLLTITIVETAGSITNENTIGDSIYILAYIYIHFGKQKNSDKSFF
jgi:hypothetical protein